MSENPETKYLKQNRCKINNNSHLTATIPQQLQYVRVLEWQSILYFFCSRMMEVTGVPTRILKTGKASVKAPVIGILILSFRSYRPHALPIGEPTV